MVHLRSTAITETKHVSSVRSMPRCRHCEDGEKGRFYSLSQSRSVARALFRALAPVILALSALTVSGCMTTSEHARDNRAIPSAVFGTANAIMPPDHSSVGAPVGLVRLQSAAVDDAGANAAPAQPPLPAPTLSSSAPDPPASSAIVPSVDSAADPPAVAATALARAAPTANNADSAAVQGLSSIARNRRANRGVPNPAASDAGEPRVGQFEPQASSPN